MRKLLIIGIAALGMLLSSIVYSMSSTSIDTDEIYTVRAYCRIENVEFMKVFSRSLAEKGMEGYFDIMMDPAIPCFDSRLHKSPSIYVRFIKKMWLIQLSSEYQLEVWTIEDSGGTTGFTWVPVIPANL